MKRYIVIILCLAVCLLAVPKTVRASENVEENQLYNSLNEKIKNNFYEGIEDLENQESLIEISGNLVERFMRSVVNALYRNLDTIKAGSLMIGTLSFVIGLVITMTVRLNKGLRRYAITVLMLTVPAVLLILVISTSMLIDIFS